MNNVHEVNQALSNNYMLVQASFSAWSPRKSAKDLAREAEQRHGAVEGSVSSSKNIMAGVDDDLKEVTSAQSKIRAYVYEHTLPFGRTEGPTKRGPRILAVAHSLTFIAEVKKLTDEYEAALQKFLGSYPGLMHVALQNLSVLATAEDYPDPMDMPRRFSASIGYDAVPQLGAFDQLQLPSDVLESLSDSMAKRQVSALQTSFSDLRQRISEELARTITQLTKIKAGERTSVFKSMQTSVQNLSGLLEASIPLLGDDPKLKELHEKLHQLGQINPESYRKTQQAVDKGEQLANQAAELLNGLQEDLGASADTLPQVRMPPPPAAPAHPPAVLTVAPPRPALGSDELDNILEGIDSMI